MNLQEIEKTVIGKKFSELSPKLQEVLYRQYGTPITTMERPLTRKKYLLEKGYPGKQLRDRNRTRNADSGNLSGYEQIQDLAGDDMENSQTPLQKLYTLPMQNRIEAVWHDMTNREDYFGQIDFIDLADALDASPNALRESDWNKWECYLYDKRISIEEYCQEYEYLLSDVLLNFEPKEELGRHSVLLKLAVESESDDNPKYDFLTAEERLILTEAINLENFDTASGENIAFYTIETESGELKFQAADNGYEFYDLGTPYDYRDGLFIELHNSEYYFYFLNE